METVHVVSSAGTGYFYSYRRKKSAKKKINRKKFDPIVGMHVLFEEKSKPAKAKIARRRVVRGELPKVAGKQEAKIEKAETTEKTEKVAKPAKAAPKSEASAA